MFVIAGELLSVFVIKLLKNIAQIGIAIEEDNRRGLAVMIVVWSCWSKWIHI